MPTEINYTSVELCTYENNLAKAWFVYFDMTDFSSGVSIRKQFRGGINYHKSVKERLSAGLQLKKYWEERLRHGWSPFISSGVNSLSKMGFNESLDWALSKCQASEKTILDYGGTVKFFKGAAKKLHFDKASISTIKRQQILLMLDQITKDRKWSNHAYNKNAGYISGVLSRLTKYQVIENNPAHGIEDLPVAETNMYETITDEEKIIIRDYLTMVHPPFFTYLMLIYHTGIRPKECLALKFSDIHLNKQLIIIKPVLVDENSKTKEIRMVPLNNHIVALLSAHVEGHTNIQDFVFGSPNASCGNRGSQKGNISGAMRSDYFLPSVFHMKRDTATKLWNKLIIVGLGIKKYQYALKHTGGDDKILAGISLDALKTMYGHTSKFMTEKYAKKIKGVYREQIILNSPDF